MVATSFSVFQYEPWGHRVMSASSSRMQPLAIRPARINLELVQSSSLRADQIYHDQELRCQNMWRFAKAP
jgi:hypothetical protein